MKNIIILTIVLTALSACSVNSINEYDSNTTSLNKSSILQRLYDDQSIPGNALFGWSTEKMGFYPDNRLNHVSMDRLLQRGIVKALLKKGYRFTNNAENADYLVTYTAALKSALSDEEVLQTFGAEPGFVSSRKQHPHAEKGTLIVDVINQRTQRLHWRAIGQAFAKLDKIPLQHREQRVEQFLNLMLSDLH